MHEDDPDSHARFSQRAALGWLVVTLAAVTFLTSNNQPQTHHRHPDQAAEAGGFPADELDAALPFAGRLVLQASPFEDETSLGQLTLPGHNRAPTPHNPEDPSLLATDPRKALAGSAHP